MGRAPVWTVVQLAVDAGIPFDPGALSADVSKAVSWVHLSGTLHDTVAAQPERYLHPSPQLGALLAAARAGGKKLFLLTNSALGFVDKGMQFLVGDNWQQHFDVVITSAHKPAFYTSDSAFRVYSSNVGVARTRASTTLHAMPRVRYLASNAFDRPRWRTLGSVTLSSGALRGRQTWRKGAF